MSLKKNKFLYTHIAASIYIQFQKIFFSEPQLSLWENTSTSLSKVIIVKSCGFFPLMVASYKFTLEIYKKEFLKAVD